MTSPAAEYAHHSSAVRFELDFAMRCRHQLFVDMVRERVQQQHGGAAPAAEGGVGDGPPANGAAADRHPWDRNRPADLPVYRSGDQSGDGADL